MSDDEAAREMPDAAGVIVTTADVGATRSAMALARCAGWLLPGAIRGTTVLPETVDGRAVRPDVLAAALSLATAEPVLLLWWSAGASGYLLWSARRLVDQHVWGGDGAVGSPVGDAAVLTATVPLPFPDEEISEHLAVLLAEAGHPLERVHALCTTLALPVEGFGVLAGGAPVAAIKGAEHVGRSSLGDALRQAFRRRRDGDPS